MDFFNKKEKNFELGSHSNWTKLVQIEINQNKIIMLIKTESWKSQHDEQTKD